MALKDLQLWRVSHVLSANFTLAPSPLVKRVSVGFDRTAIGEVCLSYAEELGERALEEMEKEILP